MSRETIMERDQVPTLLAYGVGIAVGMLIMWAMTPVRTIRVPVFVRSFGVTEREEAD